MFGTNSEMSRYMCYYKFLRKHTDKRRDLHFCPILAMHVFSPIAMMTCGQNSVCPNFVLNQYISRVVEILWVVLEHSSLSPLIWSLPYMEIHHGAQLLYERRGQFTLDFPITIHVSYTCIFSFTMCFILLPYECFTQLKKITHFESSGKNQLKTFWG